MKQIESNFVDLTVTSPPYNTLRDYKGFEWNFEELAKQLYRITKPGGVVVWVVGDETKGKESLTSFRQALFFDSIGFWMHDTMIYRKNQIPSPSSNRYYQRFEYMFILSKDGPPKTFNPIKDRENVWQKGSWKSINVRKKDGSIEVQKEEKEIKKIERWGVRDNIWSYNVGFEHSTSDKIAKGHPAVFPERLAKDHIISWSNKGELVFDPFVGSGTSCKMAKISRRNYIGFDISQEYIDMANERLIATAVPTDVGVWLGSREKEKNLDNWF